MLSRRLFLQGSGGLILAGSSLGAYAGIVEPGFRLAITRYHATPPGWPANLPLTCAVIADLHACEPWMPVSRIRHIVEVTNALAPDIVVLLGDFNGGHRWATGPVYAPQWAEVFEGLKSPLGTHAILGNHDWWHGALPSIREEGGESVRVALRQAGITVLENDALRLSYKNKAFWLAGLADQMAVRTGMRGHRGLDDLDGTLAQVTDDAPVLLLAHEPDIYPQVPARVALTLCGHTHGGQVQLPLISPWYERHRMGTKHVYGHIVEGGRHMIISGGLGTSLAPIRFNCPPEIVLVTLGGRDAASSTV